MHQITTLFSDRGTPDGYRHMHGFGSHTFSLINDAGERVYVKWHFKTRQGIKNLDAAEAVRLAGSDPDYAQRDLFNAIACGDYPQWDVELQVATPQQLADWEARTGWNPFDLTKVWPHGDFPVQPVGVLELNRNPVNYHAEVEQAAFSPAHVVPGLGYSPDKMLQGRLFGYHDAALYRVGTNHQHLPVNAPRCPVHNQQRDGTMAMANGGSAPNYDPVNAAGYGATGIGHGEPELPLAGGAGRFDGRGHEDDYTQAGNLFRLMPEQEQRNLCANFAGPLSQVTPEILERQLRHFDAADPAYGAGVRTALKERGVNVD
jgi:catalase